jgi:hypothetical protein
MFNRLVYFDDYLIDYLFLIVIVIVINRKIFKNNFNHNRNHLKKFGIPNRNRNRKKSKNSIFSRFTWLDLQYEVIIHDPFIK